MNKRALIILTILTICMAIGVALSLLLAKETPKKQPQEIEAVAVAYYSDSEKLKITTPDGKTAEYRYYSVTFEATAETTTITLNKGKTNEIIITLTEGEE